MTAPVVEQIVSSGGSSGSGTTHTLSYPSTVNSGDFLVAALNVRADTTATWPTGAGWAELLDVGGYANAFSVHVGYYWADGTEDGGTFDVEAGATAAGSWVVHRISGAHASTPPETNGAPAGEDPPSVTPSGGADDYLSVAYLFGYYNFPATGWPSGYGDTGTEGGYAPIVAWASLGLSGASSEDPGVFASGGASTNTASVTVMVYPAALGNTGVVTIAFSDGSSMRGIGVLRGVG